jgi:3-oxo-5-alpha-steroid 4-dehydrogenase 1
MIHIYEFSVLLIFILAVIVFVILFFVSAPYGKFRRKGWGPEVKSKWAWMIMEFPSPALILYFFITSDRKNIILLVFLLLWLTHYLHRTFIYPFRHTGKEKEYPVILVAMAFFFNILNGFINGYGVFHVYSYNLSWFLSWQFICGIFLFAAGFAINKISDKKLMRFRKQGGSDYVIPRGWLFDLISCPHYFGEIMEWAGWAVLTWSLPGLGFFVFTFANLFPRAVSSHNWYREKFPEYPVNRKAVLPFII